MKDKQIKRKKRQFRIRKKMIFYILGEMRREAFLNGPDAAELMLFGGDKDE